MLAKLKTFSLLGIDALPVEVEVDVSPAGLPKTVLVGLPEAAVKESTHRVERAIVNSGFQRPQNRVVINLAPADLPKEAASFDLPIALGILAGSGQIAAERLDQYAVVGELALDGTHAAHQGRAVDGHGRRRAGGPARPARAHRQRGRGGRGRRRRGHPRGQPGPGRGLSDRRDRDRAAALAARRAVPHAVAATKSISPTSAARRWPSGR